MNRKNLTAAVLAGLVGIAGIAGTAQAVNLNPDGVGQVLIYPYYTSNDGNQTIFSVVNTTDQAKAVKVRFLEGFNSREVLDFNLYLSEFDVWVAAIADDAGTPTLFIPDNSCTVPYLYGLGIDAGLDYGMQPFLDFAYTGDFTDGGPTTIARAAEGHIEAIEMGVLTNESEKDVDERFEGDPGRLGSADAATHVVAEDGSIAPADCEQLVRNWTEYEVSPAFRDDDLDGMWFDSAIDNSACDDPDDPVSSDCKTEGDDDDIERNRGGLFGSAAIINAANGTMFSYDPKAVQGFDKRSGGLHYIPGTIHPSLADGSEDEATIFFGTPQDEAVTLFYDGRSVDAISALFMHDHIMNEFTIEASLNAATEWVFTFPTKNFYVDPDITSTLEFWSPTGSAACNFWQSGQPFPGRDGPDPEDDNTGTFDPDDDNFPTFGQQANWLTCVYVLTEVGSIRPPFTTAFDGKACEEVEFFGWDRNENAIAGVTPGENPPIVSPAPPGDPSKPGAAPFELCYEVNILRFGDEEVFGTTSDLLLTVTGTADSGWADVNFSLLADDDHPIVAKGVELHQDLNGLVGLPVIGFAAYEFENSFLGSPGASVLANYGGLFGHKGSVRRISPDCDYHDSCD